MYLDRLAYVHLNPHSLRYAIKEKLVLCVSLRVTLKYLTIYIHLHWRILLQLSHNILNITHYWIQINKISYVCLLLDIILLTLLIVHIILLGCLLTTTLFLRPFCSLGSYILSFILINYLTNIIHHWLSIYNILSSHHLLVIYLL